MLCVTVAVVVLVAVFDVGDGDGDGDGAVDDAFFASLRASIARVVQVKSRQGCSC